MGKFFSQLTMSAFKHEQEVHNSFVKRGEIPVANHTTMIYCGCGDETCCFISNTGKYMEPKASPALPQPKK